MSFFQYPSLKDFGGLMNCINVMMEEPSMRIDEKGISCKGMDPGHVAMVEFNLPPTAFDRFTPFDELIVWNLEWLRKRMFKNPTKDMGAEEES